MAHTCRHCHTPQVEGASFCHACGQPVRSSSPAELTVVTTPRRRRKRKPSEKAAHSKKKTRNRERRSIRAATDRRECELWHGTFSAKGLVHYWLAVLTASLVLCFVALASHVDRVAWQGIVAVISLAWGAMLGWLIYLKLNAYYVLTNQRFLHKNGILIRHTRRIEVIDIDDISYRQGIIEQLLKVGTIEIISSDVTDPVFELHGIENVEDVALMIDDARRAERVRRGLHIETV